MRRCSWPLCAPLASVPYDRDIDRHLLLLNGPNPEAVASGTCPEAGRDRSRADHRAPGRRRRRTRGRRAGRDRADDCCASPRRRRGPAVAQRVRHGGVVRDHRVPECSRRAGRCGPADGGVAASRSSRNCCFCRWPGTWASGLTSGSTPFRWPWWRSPRLALLFSPSALQWLGAQDVADDLGQRRQLRPGHPIGDPLVLRFAADGVVQRDRVDVPVQHRPRQPRVAVGRRIRGPAPPASCGPARACGTADVRTGLPGRCPPRRPRWRSCETTARRRPACAVDLGDVTVHRRRIAEKRLAQLHFGDRAFVGGMLELGELVNHRGQFGLVAGAARRMSSVTAATPRAARMVLNFVVVSSTSSSGSDSATMPPPAWRTRCDDPPTTARSGWTPPSGRRPAGHTSPPRPRRSRGRPPVRRSGRPRPRSALRRLPGSDAVSPPNPMRWWTFRAVAR